MRYDGFVRSHVLIALVLSSCTHSDSSSAPDASFEPTIVGTDLKTISPQMISNQTSHTLLLTGTGFTGGLTLHVGPTKSVKVQVIDAAHGTVKIEPFLFDDFDETTIPVSIGESHTTLPLTIINDSQFSTFRAATRSPDARTLFVADEHTDSIKVIDLTKKTATQLASGDGPSALTFFRHGKESVLAAAHRFEPTIWLFDESLKLQKKLPGYLHVTGLISSKDGHVLYAAESVSNSIAAIDVEKEKEIWRTPVDPNPREILVAGEFVVAGSLQAGTLTVLNRATGTIERVIEMKKGLRIVGGPTAPHSQNIMGAKAVRGLAYSEKLKKLFVSSIGPNIGPNEEKMEVSMNGGIAVVDLKTGFQHHLGFGAGVTDALLLDETNQLLFAADTALGLVRIIDAKLLVTNVEKALLQEVAMPIPKDMPLIRPAADFAVNNRASVSLHAGPTYFSINGNSLWVMNRFSRSMVRLNVSDAKKQKAHVADSFEFAPIPKNPQRLKGEILYYADIGRTGMSCDACHIDGHTGGVFFEKTKPMRIYRSTTIRGARHTAPYFTPASTTSLAMTSEVVGSRNRYQNPKMTTDEIDALTSYSSLIPTLPNPFVLPDGTWPEKITLPDGKIGNPKIGMGLFETKAQCESCHSFGEFTTDANVATRGKYVDVGTPHLLPLKEKWQDATFKGFAVPSLLGLWDVFPMLTTGAAGFAVGQDEMLHVGERFPLKKSVIGWAKTHGRADVLSEQELNDLLAFLMML
jgi:DNA-binding beta-propeller fold protein YncE